MVALGIDWIREIDDQLGRAEQRTDPEPPRHPLRADEEQPGEQRGHYGGAEDADLRLGQAGAVEGE